MTAVERRYRNEVEDAPRDVCADEDRNERSQHRIVLQRGEALIDEKSNQRFAETGDRAGQTDDEVMPRLGASRVHRHAAHSAENDLARSVAEHRDRAGVREFVHEYADEENGRPEQSDLQVFLVLVFVEHPQRHDEDEAEINVDRRSADRPEMNQSRLPAAPDDVMAAHEFDDERVASRIVLVQRRIEIRMFAQPLVLVQIAIGDAQELGDVRVLKER